MARQQGFSLIEVLMVLLIIGIATTTVSVAAFTRSDARKLRLDANRLAQLFAVAQAQARTAGRPVVWIYDTQGYRFAHTAPGLFLPAGLAAQAGVMQAVDFSASSPLRPRHWTPDDAIDVRIEPPGAALFNSEWISGPVAVELSDGTHAMRIERLGNGQYRVAP